MKCPNCGIENKNDADKCKKCGLDLTISSTWKPSLKWHLTTLGVIYVFLIGLYFLLNHVIK